MGRQTLIRIGIAFTGAGLIAIGIAGIVLPILPGWALIVGGLLMLSREFDWARRVVDRLREVLVRRGLLRRTGSSEQHR